MQYHLYAIFTDGSSTQRTVEEEELRDLLTTWLQHGTGLTFQISRVEAAQ